MMAEERGWQRGRDPSEGGSEKNKRQLAARRKKVLPSKDRENDQRKTPKV